MNKVRTISSTEAQSNFGLLMKWAGQLSEKIIVEQRGTPQIVVMSYERSQELEKLEEQELRRQVWLEIESLRKKTAQANPKLTRREAYQAAGFSQVVIEETLAMDETLSSRSPDESNI